MQEKWGHQIYYQWKGLFRARPHIERRGSRRYLECMDQRVQYEQVGSHVEKLGGKLAKPQLSQRPEPVLQSPGQQWPHHHGPRRGAFKLEFWPVLFQQHPILRRRVQTLLLMQPHQSITEKSLISVCRTYIFTFTPHFTIVLMGLCRVPSRTNPELFEAGALS